MSWAGITSLCPAFAYWANTEDTEDTEDRSIENKSSMFFSVLRRSIEKKSRANFVCSVQTTRVLSSMFFSVLRKVCSGLVFCLLCLPNRQRLDTNFGQGKERVYNRRLSTGQAGT